MRRSLLTAREAADAACRLAWDRSIGARLDQWVNAWITARRNGSVQPVIGVYWPIRAEPDLMDVWLRWLGEGRRLALPRIIDADRPLAFGRWCPGQALTDASFGTRIPEPFEPVLPALLVMPCVGFDARAFRLGYGGGYYDRTLAALGVDAVGVCHEIGWMAAFAPEAHDRPMRALLTESRSIEPRQPSPCAPRNAP